MDGRFSRRGDASRGHGKARPFQAATLQATGCLVGVSRSPRRNPATDRSHLARGWGCGPPTPAVTGTSGTEGAFVPQHPWPFLPGRGAGPRGEAGVRVGSDAVRCPITLEPRKCLPQWPRGAPRGREEGGEAGSWPKASPRGGTAGRESHPLRSPSLQDSLSRSPPLPGTVGSRCRAQGPHSCRPRTPFRGPMQGRCPACRRCRECLQSE